MKRIFTLLLSLALKVILGPVIGDACANIFWFFSYHLTVLPILAVLPVFLLLGGLVPLLVYRSVARRTIVERLRDMDV